MEKIIGRECELGFLYALLPPFLHQSQFRSVLLEKHLEFSAAEHLVIDRSDDFVDIIEIKYSRIRYEMTSLHDYSNCLLSKLQVGVDGVVV